MNKLFKLYLFFSNNSIPHLYGMNSSSIHSSKIHNNGENVEDLKGIIHKILYDPNKKSQRYIFTPEQIEVIMQCFGKTENIEKKHL